MYKNIGVILCLLAICTAGLSGCARKDTLLLQNAAGEAEISGPTAPAEAEPGPEASREAGERVEEESRALQQSGFCYVHICGEVAQPGVYKVEKDARVYQVIGLAGGLTEGACPDYVNQAAAVEDGMKIVIPSVAEAETLPAPEEAGTASSGSGGLVNINTAAREELCTLTGIGESRAESIITYRTEHGGFSCIEDIMKVEGIKEGAFSKIKDKITVR